MHPRIPPVRAVGVLTFFAIFAIVLATTILLLNLRARELDHSRLETESIARMLMEQTQDAFHGADLVLQGVQERLENDFGRKLPLDGIAVHLLLSSRISDAQQIRSIFIISPDGLTLNSSGKFPADPIPAADRGYYQAFVSRHHQGLFIDKPVRSRSTNNWTLHLARPLPGTDGRLRGILVIALNLRHFEEIYNFTKLDFPRPIALYMDDGTLIASLPHREGEVGDPAPELGRSPIPMQDGEVAMLTHHSGDGSQETFALGQIPNYPLRVSVTDDEVEALATWRETAAPIAIGAGLTSAFIAIVAVLLVMELRREAKLARALREADDRYQRTIESMMDAIVAVDDAQKVILFNPAAERMFGLSARQAIGMPLERLLPDRMRARHRMHVERFKAGGATSRTMETSGEITGKRADGSEFPIEATISQTLIDGKRQFTAVLRDITDRQRAEKELREMNRQLHSLSAALQNVREQERTRISRELHDDLGQQLTGLKLDLSWLVTRLRSGHPPEPEKVDDMRRLLDSAIVAVRRISSELRPTILDDLGFGDAVKWLAQETAKRSDIAINLDLPAAERIANDTLATALFRIVQESLTNIVRHAGATRVDIRLAIADDRLTLTIRDNGCGLTAAARPGTGGIGLVSMRERAMALGGHFSISSTPGEGVVVAVTVPLDSPVFGEKPA